MFLFDVARDFDTACKAMLDKNEHLGIPWTFIKDHERRPVVLTNICRQILSLEHKAEVTKLRFTQKDRKQIIAACAQLFVKMAIQQRDQSVLSEADKYLISEKDKAKREVEEMGILKEVNSAQKSIVK